MVAILYRKCKFLIHFILREHRSRKSSEFRRDSEEEANLVESKLIQLNYVFDYQNLGVSSKFSTLSSHLLLCLLFQLLIVLVPQQSQQVQICYHQLWNGNFLQPCYHRSTCFKPLLTFRHPPVLILLVFQHFLKFRQLAFFC